MPTTPLWASGATLHRGSRSSDSGLSGSERPDHATACFVVAAGGGISEVYGMTGPASAWASARRRPMECRRIRWTRRRAAPAYATTPDLTSFVFVMCKIVDNVDIF